MNDSQISLFAFSMLQLLHNRVLPNMSQPLRKGFPFPSPSYIPNYPLNIKILTFKHLKISQHFSLSL